MTARVVGAIQVGQPWRLGTMGAAHKSYIDTKFWNNRMGLRLSGSGGEGIERVILLNLA